ACSSASPMPPSLPGRMAWSCMSATQTPTTPELRRPAAYKEQRMQLRARILAIVFVALVWPAIASVAQAQAQAPDPDRLAAPKDMKEASRVDRHFEPGLPLLLGHLKDSFSRLAPDKRADIDNVFEQMQSKFIN